VAWSKKRNALGINLASCRLHRIKNLHQSNNNLLFTGRELDLGATVYYFRCRYYNAGFQRFLSEDPIGFAGGIPISIDTTATVLWLVEIQLGYVSMQVTATAVDLTSSTSLGGYLVTSSEVHGHPQETPQWDP
jgi:RHS repeat-associated protein